MNDSNGTPVSPHDPVPFVVTVAGYREMGRISAATPPPCGECDFCVCVEVADAAE